MRIKGKTRASSQKVGALSRCYAAAPAIGTSISVSATLFMKFVIKT